MKHNLQCVIVIALAFSVLCVSCGKKEKTETIESTTDGLTQNGDYTVTSYEENVLDEEYIVTSAEKYVQNETYAVVSSEKNSVTVSGSESVKHKTTEPTKNIQIETTKNKNNPTTNTSADSAQSGSSILDYFTQSVKPNYYERVKSDKPLEKKYIGKGNYTVSYSEYEAEDKSIGKYEIWYPTEISTTKKTYPVVVMANGTGVKASSYKAVFEHLATWGFVVIGNEDEESWDGESSAKTLDFILQCNSNKNSLFYKKIDMRNIGIAGHSQGGVGAINAVTAQANGNLYKAMYTASTTHLALAQGLSWPYDVSKIKIPYFMTAGTMQFDAGNEKDSGIAPLWSLQENYQAIPKNVPKVLARRVDTDHGNMLANADGYMTAWFMYYLQGDEDAGKIFFGQNAEILSNANWQDVEKNV
ncbi:MAG: hypothetical protein ACI4VW_09530 [Acutalibacteraceae bacterium]